MILTTRPTARRKAVWGLKRTLAAAAVLVFGLATNAMAARPQARRVSGAKAGRPNASATQHRKLDKELAYRADFRSALQKTNVIVTLKPGAQLPAEFKRFAKLTSRLGIINGQVLSLPNGLIKRLSQHPDIFDIRYDRPLQKLDYRTEITTGGLAVQRALGLTGAGIGVAIIDSGIAQWHDDLTNTSSTLYPYGNQRVSAFVDFVNGQIAPYDDEGHGTHVAGIIAGNGFDSNGKQAGVAPEASLISLKVLDSNGAGTISNIIQALDWVLANHTQYNIRVVNMSVGAGVTESYWTDPLTLATKRLVDAGIVVVAAAGNAGKNALGQTQYGAIVAPGNAPWVLTVGASSHQGTADRSDDVIAGFSSRGPTAVDFGAKPDLVAPGKGTVSLSAPGGTFYLTKGPFLSDGLIPTPYKPYLTLSGTSMASPVVAGTVALMLQANPSLTPNAVKAILQYTAQVYPNYNGLTQGAGFLNTVGAVRLAQFYATAQPGDRMPTQASWGKKIIWGTQRLSGGYVNPAANAFAVGTNWGVGRTDAGQPIVWGTACATVDCNIIDWAGGVAEENIVWGTSCSGVDCETITWGTSVIEAAENVVWGTDCGGSDCENVVWGTADALENVVWGTDCNDPLACLENIVWGTAAGDDAENVVWGTSAGNENLVWSSDTGQTGAENIVWGTDANGKLVWGTNNLGTITWDLSAVGTVTPLTWSSLFNTLTDEQIFVLLNWIGGGFHVGGGL